MNLIALVVMIMLLLVSCAGPFGPDNSDAQDYYADKADAPTYPDYYPGESESDATQKAESFSETIVAGITYSKFTQEAKYPTKLVYFDPTSIPRETWRILFPQGCEFIADDQVGDKDFDAKVTLQARNLAIPFPYHWDLYRDVPENNPQRLRTYLLSQGNFRGFRIAVDYQDSQGIYLFTMVKGDPVNQKIAFQWWPSTVAELPLFLVIYWGF